MIKANKAIGDPNLRTFINPVLQWLIRHGWEWPDWGTKPVDQVTIALAIHELAAKVRDTKVRKQIQSIAAKTVAESAQAIVRDSK